MPVAEIFLGAFVTVLFEKLASGELIKLARSAGIYSELNKWTDTLAQIQAVLVDAAQKQIKDRSVQLWLNKLQHLAYEIDDVLDDLTTEAMRRQLNQQSHASTSKVFKHIPAKLHALKYGHKMSSNLDKITTKLRLLVEEKNLLGLSDNVQSSARPTRRFEETSLVDKSKVVGRESDEEALLGKLLEKEIGGQNMSVVSIIGLGGIGKTTVARVLYNNKKVKDHFKLMSWVCVSDDFDVFNISKAIFKDVSGEDRRFETLNQLQVALSDKLLNKRFLVVLDDVWNEDYKEWELLQRPFTVGASGSKIIVTTRKTTVASVMDSVQTYPLEVLSYEEALSLFALNALGKQNFDSNPTRKLYGEGIILKCGRLPLALITLGRLLRTKTTDEEWEELLNSEVWNLPIGSKILPALRLSYDDLPPHLKQMFAYCCLFPKDYVFDKHELVLLWVAEGFLYESNVIKSMEKLGRECFEDLVSRSFFQQSTNDKSQYSMHDLIHDLATNVAGEFFALIDKMDAHDMNETLEKVHHLSYIREEYGANKQFKVLQRARRLRTFLAMSVTRLERWQSFYLSSKVLLELLPQLQFLRVLSLVHYNIKEVPQSICSLKHLRYLNVSNTEITCLPAQVGDLYNLQSLLLSGCHELSSLPNSIVKLVNLRHLDLSDTPQLNKFPLGICGLTSLQTLSKVIIGGSGEFKISDLQRLVHLEGQISIKDLHNVTNGVHANEAMLQQKKRLCDLEMEWSDVFDDSRNEITEYEVLEGLRPFEKLRSLEILYYMGTKFPSWVGDSSFDCLTQLTLRGCGRCTCLPTLGHLPSLEELFVSGMSGLKTLGLEFLGPPNSCDAFPSLKVLEFRDMACWEEWSSSDGEKDRTTGSFRCLKKISMKNCHKLEVVAIELLPSLRDLHIEGCSVEVLKSMVGSSSSVTSLTMKKITGLAQLNREILEHLQAVEYLGIYDCDEVTYLWESEIEACNILVNLKRLEVSGCVNLVSLGEKNVELVINKETFRHVEISKCPKLESYNCPISTEMLAIYNCGSVTSLTFSTMHDLPSALKNLRISRCDNLEVDWLLNNFLSSLESLCINLQNLRFFPEGCLLHLTRLKIDGCDNIESIPKNGYGFLPFHCLRSLYIINCKNLKSFPHEHLQSLTSLEHMSIHDCPSMDNSFPCGLWPPNLNSLIIGGLKKPISKWGMQNFPKSLVELLLVGNNSGMVTFANAGDMKITSYFLLPSSLKCLCLNSFDDLKSVAKGLEHLTCLEQLDIQRCRKLIDLPETLLPSLSCLSVDDCSPKLFKKCSRKGKLWPIISQIPDLYVGK